MSEVMTALKGDILNLTIKNLALSGSLFNPDPTTQETILEYIEYGVMELEANGIRISWIASPDFPDVSPSTGDESGVPIGMIAPLSRWLALNCCSSIGIVPSQKLEQMARSAPQTLMKFDWASITPKLKIRAGAPIGSGNTRYRLTPDFMPEENDIDVENSTQLDDLTI